MHIIFDARHLGWHNTGIARFSREVLSTLLRSPVCATKCTILVTKDQPQSIATLLAGITPLISCEIHSTEHHLKTWSHFFSMHNEIDTLKGDLYLYPHFDPPRNITTRTHFVVHDLLPLIVPNYVQRFAFLKRAYFKATIAHRIKSGYRAFTPTETTKRDIESIILQGRTPRSPITICSEASFLAKKNTPPSSVRTTPPFLLYVGDRRPHKNLEYILSLYAELRKQGSLEDLYLVGSPKEYTPHIPSHLLATPGIQQKGTVSDDTLAEYYRDCSALVFLSTYEGFGLPVIEAATYNRKLILSDIPAFREIAPPWALLLSEGLSLQDAATVVFRYLKEPQEIQARTYLNRFSWDITASILCS